MSKRPGDDFMQVICVSHSDRPFFDVRSSINFLEQRFEDGRLAKLPPFESLDGIGAAVPYNGALSIWGVMGEGNDELVALASYAPDYKVQFASFLDDRLVVLGSDRIEILDPAFKVLKTITDPWIAGGHTLYPVDQDNVWITSAPANAALQINLQTGQIVERLRMPDECGSGYSLSPENDLRDHFIPTDFQPTHLNSAVPDGDGLLTTFWIQGSVGHFDGNRNYREITSGFVGCHGARRDDHTGHVYLTDSSAGLIWIIDPDTGKIVRRIQVASRWVHDACLLSNSTAVLSASDSNELLLIDWHTGTVKMRANCAAFGKTTMFVNPSTVGPAWTKAFRKKQATPIADKLSEDEELGVEALMDLYNYRGWLPHPEVALRVKGMGEIVTDTPVQYEFLLNSRPVPLEAGTYCISAEVECLSGGVNVGLLNFDDDVWMEALNFDTAIRDGRTTVSIDEPLTAQVVISSNNPIEAEIIHAIIHRVSLRPVLSQKHADPPDGAHCGPKKTKRPARSDR